MQGLRRTYLHCTLLACAVRISVEELRSQLAQMEGSRSSAITERDQLSSYLKELVGKVDELSGLFTDNGVQVWAGRGESGGGRRGARNGVQMGQRGWSPG